MADYLYWRRRSRNPATWLVGPVPPAPPSVAGGTPPRRAYSRYLYHHTRRAAVDAYWFDPEPVDRISGPGIETALDWRVEVAGFQAAPARAALAAYWVFNEVPGPDVEPVVDPDMPPGAYIALRPPPRRRAARIAYWIRVLEAHHLLPITSPQGRGFQTVRAYGRRRAQKGAYAFGQPPGPPPPDVGVPPITRQIVHTYRQRRIRGA